MIFCTGAFGKETWRPVGQNIKTGFNKIKDKETWVGEKGVVVYTFLLLWLLSLLFFCSNCFSCYETLLAAWRVSLILVYIAGLLTKTTHRCLCKMSLLAGSVTFRCECRLDIGGTDAGWLGIVF